MPMAACLQADPTGQVDAERPHHAAEALPQPVKEARTPRIEYRKRRSYALRSAA
jgi:hypothetical protein